MSHQTIARWTSDARRRRANRNCASRDGRSFSRVVVVRQSGNFALRVLSGSRGAASCRIVNRFWRPCGTTSCGPAANVTCKNMISNIFSIQARVGCYPAQALDQEEARDQQSGFDLSTYKHALELRGREGYEKRQYLFARNLVANPGLHLYERLCLGRWQCTTSFSLSGQLSSRDRPHSRSTSRISSAFAALTPIKLLVDAASKPTTCPAHSTGNASRRKSIADLAEGHALLTTLALTCGTVRRTPARRRARLALGIEHAQWIGVENRPEGERFEARRLSPPTVVRISGANGSQVGNVENRQSNGPTVCDRKGKPPRSIAGQRLQLRVVETS